jgi:hypothetical protein
MAVTFWGNFASRTLSVPFHWRGMCYAHHSAGKGRRACEKLNCPARYEGHHRRDLGWSIV